MTWPLPETITIWNPVGGDGLGGVTWSAPVQVPGRIAYKQSKFTDKNGDDVVSIAVCYSKSTEITIDSMILFGASGAINPPAQANDVRAISQTPSGACDMKKMWFS